MPSTAERDPHDLGPLAWVLDELRKSLDAATQSMHRFVRDAELARGLDLSALDTSHLRVARQQLHQALGALEMVGMAAAAKVVHAMESAVQKFVLRPELCSDDAALRIERAGFALSEYLAGVLKGATASSVALFPQYRAVMELSAAERIHPADLWPPEWHWLPVELEARAAPLPYVPEVRAVLDQAVLKIVKSTDPQAAARLAQVCAGLAAAQSTLQPHSFWAIAAGYFEAMGLSLLPADIYTKRTASRILQQYAALAKGGSGPSERLAQDLVFFCAQAQPDAAAPALRAVRSAYGLADGAAMDYQTEQFGRFDPAQLALARKRMAAAAETWSALAGGDIHRMQQAAEQFAAVGESILKLHPKNRALPGQLDAVMEATARSGAAPLPAVAMEVATSVLYLEAAYEDLDPTDDQMVARSDRLAARLQAVASGAEPEPLEHWMEELYRRVSERQTMGSVVDELRTSMGEVEAALDRFFRNPSDKSVLHGVPARLAHMRGVFSVLGLDQPALASLRMRSQVDHLLSDALDLEAARTGIFEKLGNSLGALGLLIDMLGYQRAMAKKLFVYDEAQGEFRPLMGRERSVVPAPAQPAPVLVPPAPTLALVAPVLAAVTVALDFPDFVATQSYHADAGQDLPEPEIELDFPPEPAPAPAPAPEPAAMAQDEQTKVIGHLRIGIPLYNVYLNEADEWSRRLMTELSEWALELHRPLPDSTRDLAHSLGGASATVGFDALAEVARTLERALDHVQLQGQGTAPQAQVFNRAAEDIRRLLHQFAAGFLKTADPQLLRELKDILATEFSAPALSEQDDFDEQSAIATEMAPLTVLPALPVSPVRAPHSNALDALDADLFPIFQEEAADLMPALGVALRQWVARPDNQGARAEALRVLHTLKGSARLAGAMRLGEMAHGMESDIEKLGSEALQSPQLEPLLEQLDTLLAQLDTLQATLDALDLAPQVHIVPEPAAQPAVAMAEKQAQEQAEVPVPVSVPLEQVTRATPRSGGQSVRVRSQLLDRLLNQTGEVMISRSRMDGHVAQMRGSLADLTVNLESLRRQLRDVELQAETQMQSRLAQSKDEAQGFDPLEFDRFTRVQELTRMMAESVNDVATVQRSLQRSIEGAEDDLVAQGRQARELQRDLLRTRMVEFESIAERLYGVVRQAAKAEAKQVRLDIMGSTIEIDRGVLDRMTPAFEHLLRNAVAHGIERAALRVAAGKPEQGSITITVQQESNDVAVSFADDGAGLQLDKIRAQAIANKLIAPDAALSEADAAQLLFAPGFSTAAEVTELAGRGIGMDVVLTELHALGGRVETSSVAGQGTRFRLILPLTTAVTQVVMLRMGALEIGVPSKLMETVLRVPLAAVQAAYASGSYALDGQDIPFFWGGALLQGAGASQEAPGRNLPVVVLRSAGQRLALHVDEVLGNREVVVKNLGPQLARLPGLAGMSVLASGAVVLIYNPVALATVYGADARSRMAASAVKPSESAPVALDSEQAPLVLVVDDSITVRRVTQRLLQREGFRVALAHDGLHALEMLAQEKPAVVLTDIEMPRMDGFDLVRAVRADDKLRDLPVIVISSRIAQKHREHAMELGVDHYLGKPYSEVELLALIRSYGAKAQQ